MKPVLTLLPLAASARIAPGPPSLVFAPASVPAVPLTPAKPCLSENVTLGWGAQDSSFVNVTLDMTHPTVVLESLVAVKEVDCDAASVAISFSSSEGLDAAVAEWRAAGTFVLITNHMGDCDAELERGFFLGGSVAVDAQRLIANVTAEKTDIANTAAKTSISFSGVPIDSVPSRREVVLNKSLTINGDLKLPGPVTLYEYKPYVKAIAKSADFGASVTLSGYVEYMVLQGKLTAFYVDIDTRVAADLVLELDVSAAYNQTFSYQAGKLGYSLINIPGIINIGPALEFDIGVALGASGAVVVTGEVGAAIEDGNVHLDFVDAKKTSTSGWTPKYNAGLKLSEKAAVSVDPFLDLTVELEFELLGGKLDLSGGVTAQPRFNNEFTLTASQEVDPTTGGVKQPGGTCDQGVRVESEFQFSVIAFATQFWKNTVYRQVLLVHKPEQDDEATTYDHKDGPSDATFPSRAKLSLSKLWHEARVLFETSLSARESRKEALRDEATLEDTIKSLKQAQEKASAAYGAKFAGTLIEFKLGRVLQRLEYLVKIGDEAMRYSPETASYAWSAFRMIFAGLLKDFEACRSLVDSVDTMSNVIFVCEIYAKRQLQKLPIGMEEVQLLADKILDKIPVLLSLVLKFAYETRKLVLDHSSFRRTLSVMFGGSEELRDILRDTKTKVDELHKIADISFREAAMEILVEAQQDSTAALDFLQATKEEFFPAVRAIQNEQSQQKEAQVRMELERELDELMRWLKMGTSAELELPQKLLQDNLERRHPGTCKWIQEDEKFKQFYWPPAERNPHHLLWIMGDAGFGKSVLMSSIVDWIQSQGTPDGSERPIFLYFFCKTGNDSTQKGHRIMLHLLMQLLNVSKEPPQDSKEPEKSFKARMQRCVEAAKQARTKEVKDFQIGDSMQPLLIALARVLERPVYILLDALDECNDWNEGLLGAFEQTVAPGADIRILISSRPEDRIREKLDRCPSVTLTKDATAKDVESYILSSLKRIKRFSKSEKTIAGSIIATKADGMFRYAGLAVESLRQPKAVMTSFQKLMQQFPDGMAGLYRQELDSLDSDLRHMLLVALRWVVCGEGLISTETVADELEQKYDFDLDTDEEEEEGGGDSESIAASINVTARASTQLVEDLESMVEVDVNSQASDDTAQLGRDSINILKVAGRNFLKFDQENHISIQHTSVRDFVLNESKYHQLGEALCPGAMPEMSRTHWCFVCYRGKPKAGALILGNLLLLEAHGQFVADQANAVEKAEEPAEDEGPDDLQQSAPLPGKSSEDLPQDSRPTNEQGTNGAPSVENQPPTNSEDDHSPEHAQVGDKDNDDWESVTSVATSFAASVARSAWSARLNPYLKTVNSSNDTIKPNLRYELTHWPYHVREAERLWPQDNRDEQEWAILCREIETFLHSNPAVLKTWEKRVLGGRDLIIFDISLHRAD